MRTVLTILLCFFVGSLFAQPSVLLFSSSTHLSDTITGASNSLASKYDTIIAGRSLSTINNWRGWATFNPRQVPDSAIIDSVNLNVNIININSAGPDTLYGQHIWFGIPVNFKSLNFDTIRWIDAFFPPLDFSGTSIGSWGTSAGNIQFRSNAAINNFLQNHETDSFLTVGFTNDTSNTTYYITGGFGTLTTTGAHAPFLKVNYHQSPIWGASTICLGGTTTMHDAVTGGTWSSSNPAVASINALTGMVTTTGIGIDTIKYILSGYTVFKVITVNQLVAPILPTAPVVVCIGDSTTLSDTTVGGVWISGSSTIATITTGGVVHGLTSGIDVITYQLSSGCFTTKVISVNPHPSPIVPPAATICEGAVYPLNDVTTGGAWSSSSLFLATVTTGGLVTATGAGTAYISYTVSGCSSVSTITILGPMPITPIGVDTICVGVPITFADVTTGGTWSFSNGRATVTSGGVATGLLQGYDTLRYSLTTFCGTASASRRIFINPSPTAGVISGLSNVCFGNFINLTESATNGSWSSSDTTIASVVMGEVTGIKVGIDTIKYSYTNYCGTAVARHTVSVDTNYVAPITGAIFSVCPGAVITLSDATSNGVWSLINAKASNFGSNITGVVSGIDTVRYSVTNGCGTNSVMHSITINPSPNAGVITGDSVLCQGGSLWLYDLSTSGTFSWSSRNNSIATVIGTSGLVQGISVGTDTISYTMTNVCGTAITFYQVRVIDTPGIIKPSVTTAICQGSSITLTDDSLGGKWRSAPINMVDSLTGVFSANYQGVSIITYKIGTCFVTKTITVAASPAPISPSIDTVCAGASVTLSETVGVGGIWHSANPSVASVLWGIVSGHASGNVTISYSIGACAQTALIRVVNDPILTAPTYSNIFLTGEMDSLTDMSTGGFWNSSNSSVATVSTRGRVDGITPGLAAISYTVAGCTVTQIVTVNQNLGVLTEEDNSVEVIRLYPNPSGSVVYIDAPVNVKVCFLKPDGSLAFETKNAKEVNIAKLTEGLYFVQVLDEQNRLLKVIKFIKLN